MSTFISTNTGRNREFGVDNIPIKTFSKIFKYVFDIFTL